MDEVFFDTFYEALAYDVDILDGSLVDLVSSSGRITIRRNAVLPLTALLTDARVRYGLEGKELFEYALKPSDC